MKRGLLAARTLATAGAVALLIGACGGSSGSSSTHLATVPVSTLTRAAYVSSAQSGYKAIIHLNESIGSSQVSMVGTGSFSPADHLGSLTMQMTLPGSVGATLGNSLNINAVFDGHNFYMKMPAVIASQVPGSKPWLELNLGTLAHAAGIPGLSALTNESSTLDDPGQYLDFLRAAASGTVKDLGQTTVDGVSTTHYQAEIDLSKLADAVPAGSRSSVQQLVAQLEKRFSAGNMPVDAWIDSSNRIRRLAMTYSLQVPNTGQTSKVVMVMDFADYGPQPKPAIPPASQTTDLLSLLHGGLAGVSG